MKTLLFLLFSTLIQAAQFVIVVPSHNNQDYYKRNLDSIFTQKYGNYRVIYIDDASTDLTASLVQNYIEEKNLKDRISFIQNEKKTGELESLYHAISSCSSQEVVVILNGNNWFSNRDVLTRLNEFYENPDTWVTYSQLIYYPSYEFGAVQEMPEHVIEENAFRTHMDFITPLPTFYAKLFHKIKKEDLCHNGEFFEEGFHKAMMLPLLEMAGEHIRFNSEVSFICNIENELPDFLIQPNHLKANEKYTPLFKPNGPLKKVYITPGYWGELFAVDNPLFNRDDCLDVMVRLRSYAREAGYELIQANSLDNLGEFEYLVVFEVFPHQLPELEKFPSEKLILFLWEPPSVLPQNYNLENHRHFSKVFTWNDALIDNQKYFKFFYPVYRPQISDSIDFHSKRLSTLIACNKGSHHPQELYSERLRVIQFFEGHLEREFDLYGRNWPSQFQTYQGAIGSKVDTLKYYRFAYAYENVRDIPGYVTEKIFDCFQAKVIPIYIGASNINEYIPKNCYINRDDFSSNDELYQYLQTMKPHQYEEYQNNIRNFLDSEAAKKYSIENFIETFMSIFP